MLQGTIEADNKRRPGILKRNSTRYEPPPLEPPDPNSGTKSDVMHAAIMVAVSFLCFRGKVGCDRSHATETRGLGPTAAGHCS